jgi:hypothetical protein
VHEAKDLRDVQLIGKQDPYCVVSLAAAEAIRHLDTIVLRRQVALGDQIFKSRVHTDGGKAATWGDVFPVCVLLRALMSFAPAYWTAATSVA